MFTGDLPAHNVWNQSRSDITGAMELVTKMFLTYLPGKKIYNTLGNHESAPVNRYEKHGIHLLVKTLTFQISFPKCFWLYLDIKLYFECRFLPLWFAILIEMTLGADTFLSLFAFFIFTIILIYMYIICKYE